MSALESAILNGASPYKGQQLITCADGFSFSVNASRGGYCIPREDVGPYVRVEIGYPSGPLPSEWDQYQDPGQPIYGWVPVDLARALVSAHGGEV